MNIYNLSNKSTWWGLCWHSSKSNNHCIDSL